MREQHAQSHFALPTNKPDRILFTKTKPCLTNKHWHTFVPMLCQFCANASHPCLSFCCANAGQICLHFIVRNAMQRSHFTVSNAMPYEHDIPRYHHPHLAVARAVPTLILCRCVTRICCRICHPMSVLLDHGTTLVTPQLFHMSHQTPSNTGVASLRPTNFVSMFAKLPPPTVSN